MKHLNFVEPNFKCEVEDRGGHRSVIYLHAASKQEIEKRIEDRRLTLLSCEPYDLKEWKARAAAQTTEAEKKRTQPGFKYNGDIWSEIKQYLFELSGGNCGYCEAETQVVSYGDVEHYRPKKKVEEDEKHPGYYWLAYDITNYVPCCRRCNDARAKANHFPLADGSPRATKPQEVAQEKPLLLNPFLVEDPSQHLRFIGPEEKQFGEMEGITPEGKASCKFYNLNRSDLIQSRCQEFNAVSGRLKLAEFQIAQWKSTAEPQASTFLQDLLDERRQYSLMVRAVVTRWLARTIQNEEEEEARRRARQKALLSALENDRKMFGS
jgi:hypothetical protein